ncbi:MAG: alpha-tubulin suppressor-like RCC1 family protein, partial [Myxococcota bacterium]
AGTVTCWGSNAFDKATPPTDLPLFNASAGDQHSCALTADGDRQCWGDSGSWATFREGTFATVDAGQSESCMQDNTGFVPAVACDGAIADAGPITAEQFDLGRNGVLCSVFNGEISCLGTTVTPPTGSDGDLFIEVAVGQSHYCARTGLGAVTCWGTSERGALGLPTAD